MPPMMNILVLPLFSALPATASATNTTHKYQQLQPPLPPAFPFRHIPLSLSFRFLPVSSFFRSLLFSCLILSALYFRRIQIQHPILRGISLLRNIPLLRPGFSVSPPLRFESHLYTCVGTYLICCLFLSISVSVFVSLVRHGISGMGCPTSYFSRMICLGLGISEIYPILRESSLLPREDLLRDITFPGFCVSPRVRFETHPYTCRSKYT